MYTSGALPEVLGSWGEGPFISGEGEMPNILGALENKHLFFGSLGAVSKYNYFQGAGEIISLFSGSIDSLWERLTSNHH